MDSFINQLVPLAGILMVLAVVVGPIWIGSYFKNRERQRLHETLRLMVEKGQPVSGELLETLNAGGKLRSPPSDMRRGVVLTTIGLGMAGMGLALGLTGDGDMVGPLCGMAAFPTFIGLGFVVLALVNRDKAKD